ETAEPEIASQDGLGDLDFDARLQRGESADPGTVEAEDEARDRPVVDRRIGANLVAIQEDPWTPRAERFPTLELGAHLRGAAQAVAPEFPGDLRVADLRLVVVPLVVPFDCE